jgi:hypothetical protein
VIFKSVFHERVGGGEKLAAMVEVFDTLVELQSN